MAISRAERRTERKERVVAAFGASLAEPILDLRELTEFAWHDCYKEITPPDDIINDILLCSEGDIAQLIRVPRMAVVDRRDLKIEALRRRSQP